MARASKDYIVEAQTMGIFKVHRVVAEALNK